VVRGVNKQESKHSGRRPVADGTGGRSSR
jgi:hypothetical protein